MSVTVTHGTCVSALMMGTQNASPCSYVPLCFSRVLVERDAPCPLCQVSPMTGTSHVPSLLNHALRWPTCLLTNPQLTKAATASVRRELGNPVVPF